MFDVFHEETVGPLDAVRVKRNYKMASLFSVLSLISAIFFTLFFFLMLNMQVPEGVEISVQDFLLGLLPIVILAALFYTLYFIFRSKKNSYNVFYDYTFISGELRIAKVLNGIKRNPSQRFLRPISRCLGRVFRQFPEILRHEGAEGHHAIPTGA